VGILAEKRLVLAPAGRLKNGPGKALGPSDEVVEGRETKASKYLFTKKEKGKRKKISYL